MIKQIHIYDIDGTLVDSSHRYRIDPTTGKIDLSYWIENCTPEKIMADTLLPLAAQYQAQLLNPEIYTVLATARVLDIADWRYISDVLGLPDKIVSRNGRTDNRKGAMMKIAGLRYLNNLKPFRNIAARYFYEDNKDYLYPVAQAIGAHPVFIPSMQGV